MTPQSALSTTSSLPPAKSPSTQLQHQHQQQHPPTSILRNPTAQTYAHIHPFLVAGFFTLRFRALVDDPTTALVSGLPVLAALQGVYVVLCLPAARKSSSSSSSSSGGGVGKSGGLKRKNVEETAFARRIVPALLSLFLPLVLGTPLLSLILILSGAPITTHLPATLLCAAHMSLLAGTSLVYVHGTEGSAWREIFGLARAMDAVWGGAVGVGLGAWVGAVPIPLDWDRPWQEYPITIIAGAYIGYIVGCMAGRTPLLYGRRIQFAEDEAGGESAGAGLEKDKKS
ncbi:hypothetical protein AJ80_00622 [Polytolypa hystricis UAMH7299]|uniref:Glycosylphosphatidylinositol anchor biosynthesis protein 11 n=1 Tax=Polytolypa hystricis (strain UAMH7299) TaxID=1447883 RepID=A0A2B7Z2Y9_POLH7|nr:hypothetical protein AJ80_00622 [Polytolypa hystricis UAMH7299]